MREEAPVAQMEYPPLGLQAFFAVSYSSTVGRDDPAYAFGAVEVTTAVLVDDEVVVVAAAAAVTVEDSIGRSLGVEWR